MVDIHYAPLVSQLVGNITFYIVLSHRLFADGRCK